ncbi:MAG: hypothetical protein QXJ17_05995 [Nitrososphaeria archaeon]
MVDELALLSFLRFCNALDKRRSIGIVEIAKLLKRDVYSVEVLVRTLSVERKVVYKEGQVWLLPKGFNACFRAFS